MAQKWDNVVPVQRQQNISEIIIFGHVERCFTWTSEKRGCEMGKSQSFCFFQEQNFHFFPRTLPPCTKHFSPEHSETCLLSWFLFGMKRKSNMRNAIGNFNFFFNTREIQAGWNLFLKLILIQAHLKWIAFLNRTLQKFLKNEWNTNQWMN